MIKKVISVVICLLRLECHLKIMRHSGVQKFHKYRRASGGFGLVVYRGVVPTAHTVEAPQIPFSHFNATKFREKLVSVALQI